MYVFIRKYAPNSTYRRNWISMKNLHQTTWDSYHLCFQNSLGRDYLRINLYIVTAFTGLLDISVFWVYDPSRVFETSTLTDFDGHTTLSGLLFWYLYLFGITSFGKTVKEHKEQAITRCEVQNVPVTKTILLPLFDVKTIHMKLLGYNVRIRLILGID